MHSMLIRSNAIGLAQFQFLSCLFPGRTRRLLVSESFGDIGDICQTYRVGTADVELVANLVHCGKGRLDVEIIAGLSIGDDHFTITQLSLDRDAWQVAHINLSGKEIGRQARNVAAVLGLVFNEQRDVDRRTVQATLTDLAACLRRCRPKTRRKK